MSHIEAIKASALRIVQNTIRAVMSVMAKVTIIYHLEASVFWVEQKVKGVEVLGRFNIPKSGPYEMILNHKGDGDPWRVAAAFLGTHIRWWTKRELYYWKDCYADLRVRKEKSVLYSFLRTALTLLFVRPSGVIPVDRDNKTPEMNVLAYKNSVKIFKAGGVVGIFGRGGWYGKKRKAETGFIVLAMRTGVPILPVCISQDTIIIMKPIEIPRNLHKRDRAAFAEELMQRIENMTPEIFRSELRSEA